MLTLKNALFVCLQFRIEMASAMDDKADQGCDEIEAEDWYVFFLVTFYN